MTEETADIDFLFVEDEDQGGIYSISKEFKPILVERLSSFKYNEDDELRKNVTAWILDLIGSNKTKSKKNNSTLASDIEKCLFTTSHSSNKDYIRRLKILSSYYLQTNILKDAVKAAVESSNHFYKCDLYDTFEEDERQEIKKLQIPLEVIEGVFTCPKCGLAKTFHYSMQIRRADEPPTIFIFCTNKICRHKWREG
jgi:DNA-directed RNA polymerase subunit M/transcription elongation factor TFIIS